MQSRKELKRRRRISCKRRFLKIKIKKETIDVTLPWKGMLLSDINILIQIALRRC